MRIRPRSEPHIRSNGVNLVILLRYIAALYRRCWNAEEVLSTECEFANELEIILDVGGDNFGIISHVLTLMNGVVLIHISQRYFTQKSNDKLSFRRCFDHFCEVRKTDQRLPATKSFPNRVTECHSCKIVWAKYWNCSKTNELAKFFFGSSLFERFFFKIARENQITSTSTDRRKSTTEFASCSSKLSKRYWTWTK